MATLIPPSSINDTRTQAHIPLIERLGAIDLSPMLVYLIDEVAESALPFLAWQFDILAPWWNYLAGTSSQRTLIKEAVPLHRQRGTPYSITQIVEALGFETPVIQEGQDAWGGSAWPAAQGWAVFRVNIPKRATGGASISVSAAQQTQLLSAIEFMKPQRCVLDALQFIEPTISEQIEVSDALQISVGNNIVEFPVKVSDQITVSAWSVSDTLAPIVYANGRYFCAGWTASGAAQSSVVDSGKVINGTAMP